MSKIVKIREGETLTFIRPMAVEAIHAPGPDVPDWGPDVTDCYPLSVWVGGHPIHFRFRSEAERAAVLSQLLEGMAP